MPISVDPATFIVTVPQSYCTLVTGTLYELDTEQFRDDLKAWEAGEAGIVFTDTHVHNTEVTVAGVTFARFIEIISPYSIQFTPDSQWSVRLAGSNNNIFDVENGILQQNQVQVIAQNSAGLIVVPGVVTTADHEAIADAVLDELVADHQIDGSFGKKIEDAATPKKFHISIVENGTDLDVGVWLDESQQPLTDLDSITATVQLLDGTVVEDLGTGSGGGAAQDGVWKFTGQVSLLTTRTAYVLVVNATRGSDTWTGNRGFAKTG